ncbi:MAG: exosortase C-terminal domain/associated protein EpsI [Thermoguttaceae bacterium]
MTVRLCIAAVAVLGIYAGARWAAGHGMPTEPVPLEMKAQDLPTTLGQWKGEDVALDKDVFKTLGAKMQVSRQYRDGRGQEVSVGIAVFDKSEQIQGMPHLPGVCYPANGWTLGEPKYVSLDQGGGTEHLATFVPIQRHGERSYILYWYQIEGTTYLNGDTQRKLFLACRGRPFRPPIVKVLMQAPGASSDDTEKTLKLLAGDVFQWSRGFH